MTRFILIDNHSGFIWCDLEAASPIEAARRIDAEHGIIARNYLEHAYSFRPPANATAYFVYLPLADFPPVTDGQDTATIDALQASGFLIAVVTADVIDVDDASRDGQRAQDLGRGVPE